MSKKRLPYSIAVQPAVAMQKETVRQHTSAFLLNWLAGALLFFLFCNVLLPAVFGMRQNYNPKMGVTFNNRIFGIGGLFIYFVEPLVRYSFSYRYKIAGSNNSPAPAKSVAGEIINFIGMFAVGLPYAVLVWVKPVFRALILFQSFSVLNLGDGESAMFVIIVLTDIVLYYSNLVFPNWQHNPGKLLARSAFFQRPGVYLAGSLLSIVYTTIICSGMAAGAYQQASHAISNGNPIMILLGFWYFTTIYIRMDYLEHYIDNLYALIRSMPLRNLLLNILIVVVSLVGFLWKWLWE